MLAQKIALSYGSRILLQLIQVAVTIVVARIAGPSVLGTVAFGMAFVSMFAFIADLGIPTAYIKSINDGDNEAEANGTFLRIQLGLTALFFIVVLSWLLIQKYGFHFHFETKTHEYVIIIFLVAITIQRLFQSVKTLFIARTEQAKQEVPNFIQGLIYQAIRLTIVLLGYKALAIAFSNLAATIIVIPIYIYLIKTYSFGNFNKTLAVKYFKISVPLIIILVSQTILTQSDKVILQYYSNSETVGYYTAGFKIGGFVLIIAGVIGLLFFPLFTKAIAEDDIQFINNKINKFERFMFIYVFPATVFLAIYSDVIVKVILGDKYLPTIPILSVITVSMFFLTLFKPYGNTILAKGKFYQGAFISFIQLVFFVSLIFVVLHTKIFGNAGLGVALSVFASNIFLGILFIYFSKRNIKELIVLPSFKLSLYSIIFSIIAYFIYQHLANFLWIKFVYGIMFFVVFWSLAFGMKLLNSNDWKMLQDVINLRKLGGYIKNEILH